MQESKKALRITAGILLIVLAVLRVWAILPSFEVLMKIDGILDAGFWISFGQSVLIAFIGIMILIRRFRAAIPAVIVYAVSEIADALGSIDASFRYTPFPITSASTVLLLCAVILVTVLICIRLFLHDRRFMWMLIVSAILLPVIPFLLSDSTAAQMEYLGSISLTGEGLTFALIFDFLKSLPLAVASLLLGIHFGAQDPKRKDA